MKLAQFRELCEREWEQDHGNVLALSLTGPSAAELAGSGADPDAVRAVILRFTSEDAAACCCGKIGQAVNPVTRSLVTIGVGADSDTATVRYGPEGKLRAVAIT